MTFDELAEKLAEVGSCDAVNEARILIEELCASHVSYLLDYDEAVLASAVKKRAEGYPLQYIIGKWWFAGCEFEVNENCLVPRPDTELIVEEAVKRLPSSALFADLCTGSGCIAVSVCDLRPDTHGIAVELYPKTLELAKRNAESNRVADRLSFVCGDVLCGDVLGDRKFAAIISNPPYIRTDVIDTLSREVRHEPRAALDGGGDGLVFYRAIVDKYKKNLAGDGVFILEIGYDQAKAIKEIAELSGFDCEIKKDLGGNDRAAILKMR